MEMPGTNPGPVVRVQYLIEGGGGDPPPFELPLGLPTTGIDDEGVIGFYDEMVQTMAAQISINVGNPVTVRRYLIGQSFNNEILSS